MKTTIAEQIESGKKLEVTIEYAYKNETVTQKMTVDEEGTDEWMIYNPTVGWTTNYFQGWSYQEADQNKEADYEQLLVDAINNGQNYTDILDIVYESSNSEEWEATLETNTDIDSMYELETIPKEIEVEMKIEYDVI